MAKLWQMLSKDLGYPATIQFFSVRRKMTNVGETELWFRMSHPHFRTEFDPRTVILVCAKHRLNLSVYKQHSAIYANNQINPRRRASGNFSQCVKWRWRDESEACTQTQYEGEEWKKYWFNWEMIQLTTVNQSGSVLGGLIWTIESLGHKHKWLMDHTASRALCKSPAAIETGVKISWAAVCPERRAESQPNGFFAEARR